MNEIARRLREVLLDRIRRNVAYYAVGLAFVVLLAFVAGTAALLCGRGQEACDMALAAVAVGAVLGMLIGLMTWR